MRSSGPVPPVYFTGLAVVLVGTFMLLTANRAGGGASFLLFLGAFASATWGHFCIGPGLWVERRAKAPIVYKDGTKWPSLFRIAYLETAVWEHGVAVYCGGHVPHFRWIPVGEIVSVGRCKVSRPWVAGTHAMADRGILAPHVDGVQLFLTEGRCMEIGSGDPGRLAAAIEGALAKNAPTA